MLAGHAAFLPRQLSAFRAADDVTRHVLGALAVTDLVVLINGSVPLTSRYVSELAANRWLVVQPIGRKKSIRIASQARRNLVDLDRSALGAAL